MIDIDFGGSIGRKTFDLPKKGKELSSDGALENSQYEF
jgi:hypothetical protein